MQFDMLPQLMLIEGYAAVGARVPSPAPTAYSRSVFPLVDCPPLAHGLRYVLVGRDEAGRSAALGIGRATSYSETLNLAEIRHRAAALGAREVHVLAPI